MHVHPWWKNGTITFQQCQKIELFRPSEITFQEAVEAQKELGSVGIILSLSLYINR
jgi:hypothetical protein